MRCPEAHSGAVASRAGVLRAPWQGFVGYSIVVCAAALFGSVGCSSVRHCRVQFGAGLAINLGLAAFCRVSSGSASFGVELTIRFGTAS